MKLNYLDISSNTINPQDSFNIKSKFWFSKSVFTDIMGSAHFSINRVSIKAEFEKNNYFKAILLTLAWGYPNAMRRFQPTYNNIEFIQSFLQNDKNLNLTDLYKLVGGLMLIEGLGTSTITKILFFAGFKFENIPCLILDERVKDSMLKFEEFESITEHYNHSKITTYINYLKKVHEIATRLNLKEEQIELYLYNQTWKNK